MALTIIRVNSLWPGGWLNMKKPSQSVLTLHVRGPSYLGLTTSISWLLMPWLLTSPGHQQPWYWLCRIGRFLSYLGKDFNNLCRINVEKWHKTGLGFFRKKPISSRTPGKKWKKPISSGFVQTKLEETGQNCERCQKCWKNLWSYLISYKRLWLQMHLVNWYFLKTWCRKKNNLWPIFSSFIWTKLEETGSQLGKL